MEQGMANDKPKNSAVAETPKDEPKGPAPLGAETEPTPADENPAAGAVASTASPGVRAIDGEIKRLSADELREEAERAKEDEPAAPTLVALPSTTDLGAARRIADARAQGLDRTIRGGKYAVDNGDGTYSLVNANNQKINEDGSLVDPNERPLLETAVRR
jgi:hypothetical protein